MRKVTVAATQMACTDDAGENIARAEEMVREAAGRGANIVLIQELFEGYYFCQDELPEHFARATALEDNRAVKRFSALARELGVVLPVSFFEKANNAYFNSLAMVDADGSVLGLYRKTHIPQGSGYQEKYYFSPGDTGFRVWDTAFGRIGAGICWDQWFPECARCMALMGAEILLYPTAIGSELIEPELDSSRHWQTVMCGHAGANLVPVVASNRIGTEPGLRGTELTFYGSSFIADQQGQKVAEADRETGAVLTAQFDLDDLAARRAAWGLFRDRARTCTGPSPGLDGKGQYC